MRVHGKARGSRHPAGGVDFVAWTGLTRSAAEDTTYPRISRKRVCASGQHSAGRIACPRVLQWTLIGGGKMSKLQGRDMSAEAA